MCCRHLRTVKLNGRDMATSQAVLPGRTCSAYSFEGSSSAAFAKRRLASPRWRSLPSKRPQACSATTSWGSTSHARLQVGQAQVGKPSHCHQIITLLCNPNSMSRGQEVPGCRLQSPPNWSVQLYIHIASKLICIMPATT